MKHKFGQGDKIEVSAGSARHRGVATRVFATTEKGKTDPSVGVVAKMDGKKALFVFRADEIDRDS